LQKIQKGHNLLMKTIICLLSTSVWLVATYARESCVLSKRDEACIQTFEVKCLRQIWRVDKLMGAAEANTERSLLKLVIRTKLAFVCYML